MVEDGSLGIWFLYINPMKRERVKNLAKSSRDKEKHLERERESVCEREREGEKAEIISSI